uniref:Uncharacterized protein n=1 Tax=Cacopsylla melanoneura TaxID=428564 RepID=A0A8D8V6P0_9HEMI
MLNPKNRGKSDNVFSSENATRKDLVMVLSGCIVMCVIKCCNSKKDLQLLNFTSKGIIIPIIKSSVVIENMTFISSTRSIYEVIQRIGLVRYVMSLARVWFSYKTI